MGSYGFRVSKEGVDVKTGADKDMALTSKYPVLKGKTTLYGTVNITSGTPQTITLAHGLGYIPFVQAFFRDTRSAGTYWYLTPFSADVAIETLQVYSKADSTNAYITIDWWDADGGTLTFYYKLFVYLDKGKLT